MLPDSTHGARLLRWLMLVAVGQSAAAEPPRVEVAGGAYHRHRAIVSVELPDTFEVPEQPVLIAGDGDQTPAQLDSQRPPRLWWIERDLPAGERRTYQLASAAAAPAVDLAIRDEAGRRCVLLGEKLVLCYNHAVVPSPDPSQPWYARSGFLHPVNTPLGRTITDPMPVDHLHQHGMMFAWTRSKYRGVPVDFWNQAAREGNVSHAEIRGQHVGPVFAELDVVLHHSTLEKTGGPELVLEETWRIRVFAIADPFVWELLSVQRAAGSEPLEIQQYHYGGMMIRGSKEWRNVGQYEFLTSEGQGQIEGNHTRPNWVELGGQLDGGWAGITSLGHPDNFRYPQPVRLHPSKPYFCFAPLVLGPFDITSTKPLTSEFRFVVHDGRVTREQANAWWHDVDQPPAARLIP